MSRLLSGRSYGYGVTTNSGLDAIIYDREAIINDRFRSAAIEMMEDRRRPLQSSVWGVYRIDSMASYGNARGQRRVGYEDECGEYGVQRYSRHERQHERQYAQQKRRREQERHERLMEEEHRLEKEHQRQLMEERFAVIRASNRERECMQKAEERERQHRERVREEEAWLNREHLSRYLEDQSNRDRRSVFQRRQERLREHQEDMMKSNREDCITAQMDRRNHILEMREYERPTRRTKTDEKDESKDKNASKSKNSKDVGVQTGCDSWDTMGGSWVESDCW